MITKTKAQLDAENINGTNVGVPAMEDVIDTVVKRLGDNYITHRELEAQRPDIATWYATNRNSKNAKVKAVLKQIDACYTRHREKVTFDYTGPACFGKESTATFCFALLKKDILNIQLI